jgi:hypothetical protein
MPALVLRVRVHPNIIEGFSADSAALFAGRLTETQAFGFGPTLSLERSAFAEIE